MSSCVKVEVVSFLDILYYLIYIHIERMKYGRTEGKKIILQADIGGNVDQNELWAILDSVDSDVEEDIDNLLVDSDTEFETITDDAATLIETIEENENKIPLVTDNSLEAVVHTDVPSSSSLSNVPPDTSATETEVMVDDQVMASEIDFTLTPLEKGRRRRSKVKPESGQGSASVSSDPGQTEQRGAPVKRPRKEESNKEESLKNQSEPKDTQTPSKTVRSAIDVEKLKWSRKKAADKSKECNLSSEIAFELPGTVDTKNPVKLFYSYSDFSILCSKIVTESIRYALQKGRTFTCSDREMEVFIGDTYFMGLKKLPALRDYWRTDELGVPFVRNSMSRDRYEEIRANLHFANNLDPLRARDKASKIRPLIEHFNIIYQRHANTVSHQSIDEHMVKFKGHHSMKQYVKNKPIKWGIKFWLRCDAITGYLFESDIYTGRKDTPELGLGENVVMDLTKKLKDTGVSIFANNYFSSPTLAVLLRDRGINYLGVVRKDRKGLPAFKDDKKMARGDHEMFYCKEENLMALKWIDNKSVHIISSIINAETSNAERRIKGQKEKVRVECPELIKMYNRHMGGVDINDRMKSTHEQDRRGRRYYLRLAFDMFDQLMVNSRIVFNTLNTENQLNAKEYQLVIARGIVDGFTSRSRSASAAPIKLKQSISSKVVVVDHMPIFGSRDRCKYCAKIGKDLKSFIHCSTCNIALCLNKDRNCFQEYSQDE